MNDPSLSPAASAVIELTVSAATRAAYAGALRRLKARGVDPADCDDSDLAEALGAMAAEHLSVATLDQTLAAVNWAAKTAGRPPPAGRSCAVVMSAHRRAQTRGRGRQALPLRWADCDAICAAAVTDGLAGLRDAAIISVGSDALLRRSELAALNIDDIANQTVTVQGSKTDQHHMGVTLWISPATQTHVHNWLTAADLTAGALYRPIHNNTATDRRLSAASISRIVKKRAAAIGIEGATGHSLRVGSAVSLAEAGAGTAEMQIAGRWVRPDLPAHYATSALAARTAVAKYRQ